MKAVNDNRLDGPARHITIGPRRFTWRLNPPFSPLEKAVFIVAAIPALIAGYLYGLHLLGIAQ